MGERALTARAWVRGVAAAGAIGLVAFAGAAEPGAGAVPANTNMPDSQRPLGPAVPSVQRAGVPAVEAPGVGASVLRTGLSLGAVLALLAGCLLVLKKVSAKNGSLLGGTGRAPSGVLEMLGRYPVARGQTLLLLRVDRRVLLVASCGGGLRTPSTLNTLCEVTDAEGVASIVAKVRDADGKSMNGRFAAALGAAEKTTREAIERVSTVELPDSPAPPTRRREVVSAQGDRAELWEPLPARARPSVPVRSAGGAETEASADRASVDAAAETLRRRLMALRPREAGRGEAGA